MDKVNEGVIELYIKTIEDYPQIKLLLKDDAKKIYELLEDMNDKNLLDLDWKDKEQEYKDRISELEKENKDLRERYLSEIIPEVNQTIKNIKWGMSFICWSPFWFIRNNNRYTEKYYNLLLPYLTEIDRDIIPGFRRSWNSYRHDFDGMLGLVRAVINVKKISVR